MLGTGERRGRRPRPRALDVRGFDGSRSLVCRMTFHSLLRSSSMPEPRRPPRRCLWNSARGLGHRGASRLPRRRNATRRLPRFSGRTPFVSPSSLLPFRSSHPRRALQRAPPSESAPSWGPSSLHDGERARGIRTPTHHPFPSLLSSFRSSFSGAPGRRDPMAAGGRRRRSAARLASASPAGRPHAPPKEGTRGVNTRQGRYNDPSAGSPTETLLRLLLPLDDGARRASGHAEARPPDNSPQHPIGRSDGRCVQRAGTHSARDH